MPLDALCLTAVAAELRAAVAGGKIDKLYQPTRDEVVLYVRGQGENVRLLLSANSGHPRANLTTLNRENPEQPPMFCMLLRKHLQGARILELNQPPLERILEFRLETLDELGGPASWAIFRDNRISSMNTRVLQVLCLVLFLFAVWVASKGINVLKKLSTLAGSTMFIMSLLFVVMMLAAPAITHANVLDIDWSVKTFMPSFDAKFLLNLSILVFAVGGCEKISPYVNKTKNPAKDFSKGMIALAIMVAVCAMLGTIAMGMMFDSNNIPEDLMTNGAYYAFQTLGEYYGLGNFFVVVYAICNLIGQFTVMIISIDAPLRMLLDNADDNYIPASMFKQNKHGTYTNGHKLVMIIVSILIIVPAIGIGSVDTLVRWLVKVNSVCMPLRYLWVFVAYIALKKAGEKFPAQYRFVKNRTLGVILGAWCFLFTAFACILGIYSEDTFQFVLNIVTPFVLIGLGFIMPQIAKRSKAKGQA